MTRPKWTIEEVNARLKAGNVGVSLVTAKFSILAIPWQRIPETTLFKQPLRSV
jgi:hypothetical protein